MIRFPHEHGARGIAPIQRVDQTGDLRNLAGARETADDLLKGVRGAAPPQEAK